MTTHLIQKYNVAGPRYTSYPTVPYWEENLNQMQWLQTVKQGFNESHLCQGISLYIHLPYCESLCTYCGCNKHITKNHAVERPHLNYIIKEWQMYLALFKQKPVIKELHLGGGTPTFFSAENLKYLIENIVQYAIIAPKAELSFEAHPGNTSLNHLKVLNSLGFTRISLGVQDFNPLVQKAIHRIQSLEQTESITQMARANGYNSVNFDLIYGLPFQSIESMLDTIEKTIAIKPERIAFYSYAHIPWLKPSQRGYDENDLPSADLKRHLYELGKEQLLMAGYNEIGMDHFALKSDGLFQAMQQKKLHRNFMGYTASHTKLMIGLGVSSISDSWNAFAQNVKTVKEYETLLGENKFPFLKGHLLSNEDLILRKHILNIMCHFETNWQASENYCNHIPIAIEKLKEAENDGLIELNKKGLKVTIQGIPFVRNICMAFDAKLMRKAPQTNLFSSTV
ncbi:MAG TPA: oxygen-independent coproporphyrinogen III oxidase [Bacteroidia bacterium]|nr:oxygen-independent coproporphyrinogen III oxidase [Bacteroidia bacterium]